MFSEEVRVGPHEEQEELEVLEWGPIQDESIEVWVVEQPME